MISLASALVFFIIALPQTFALTDQYLGPLLGLNIWDVFAQCPTMTGHLLHGAVFFLVSYLQMRGSYVSTGTKIKHSLKGTLMFLALTHPFTYQTVAGLLGNQIADSAGCPTVMGAGAHALVYAGLLWWMML